MSQPIPISASDWNNLFNLAAAIALTALAIVMGAMIFFAVRYRQRKGQKFIPDFSFKKSRARDSVIFASISIIILVVWLRLLIVLRLMRVLSRLSRKVWLLM